MVEESTNKTLSGDKPISPLYVDQTFPDRPLNPIDILVFRERNNMVNFYAKLNSGQSRAYHQAGTAIINNIG